MKFRITMKDPDGVYGCMMDAAKASAAEVAGMSDDEREALVESRQEKIQALARKWIEYGEYLTVEIDMDAGTIRVVPTE